MLNMVSAYIGTSYLSNSTNCVATSSCPLSTPTPTFYNDTKISSPNLHTSPVYHLPQLLREPHISSHRSQKRGLAVTSNNTAATTFVRSSTTKSTTLPPNISTSCQVYYHHKHLTPSSPFAAANHYTDYHLGYLSLLANVIRLPLFDPTDKLFCPCRRRLDPFGDPIFQCRHINKIGARNSIRDGLASNLAPLRSMAGYLLPSSKLDVEPLLHLPSDPHAPVPYPSKVRHTPHHHGGPNATLTTHPTRIPPGGSPSSSQRGRRG